MNIYRCGSFQHTIESELPSLKSTVKTVLGKSIRRIDRFTQLALIGAFNCCKQQALEGRTGLYISSSKCSLENMAGILGELGVDKRLPSPFKFVNTVGNAANFHVSQQLNLNANSVYLAKSDFAVASAFSLAQLDIQQKRIDAALVGFVTEAAMPLDTCRQLHGLIENDTLYEASTWFLLGESLNEPILAKCSEYVDSIAWDTLCERMSRLVHSENGDRSPQLRFGPSVTADKRAALSSILAITVDPSTSSNISGPHDQLSAIFLKQFAENTAQPREGNIKNNDALLIIDSDHNSNDKGLWSYMLIQKG